MLMFRAETTQDYITTSTRYRPTLEIDNTVYRPLQFTEWTNMDGYWDVRARASYGFPVNFIKSNLNLRGGVSYSRIPSLVDGERNNTGNLGYEAGVVLGSNISENVDFTLRGTARTTKPSIPSPLPEERTVISTIRLRRRSSSSSAGDSPSRAALLISSIWVSRTITTTAICSATCSWAKGLSQPIGRSQYRRERHFQPEQGVRAHDRFGLDAKLVEQRGGTLLLCAVRL